MKKLWVISGALAGVIALCALGLWYKEKKNDEEEYSPRGNNIGKYEDFS